MFSFYKDFPSKIKQNLNEFYSLSGLIPTYLETRLNQSEFADNKDDIEHNKIMGETSLVQVEHARVDRATGDTVFYTFPERRVIQFTQHQEEILDIEGLEAIQLSAKQPSQKYEIRFATDAEYGLQRARMLDIATAPEVNYLFWNYPNVGKIPGDIKTINDYVAAGITIVDSIRKQGISPKDVTLYGLEFGGHVATAVAYHFHQQKYPVRVEVYQMSSTLFSDVMSRGEDDEHPNMPIFLIHIMLMAKGGSFGLIALGIILGNFVNTLGVFFAALTYYSGQGLTNSVRFLRLELLANGIDVVMTGLSYLIYELFNGLGSLITLAVSTPLVLVFGLSFLHAILALCTLTLAYFGYNIAKPFSEFGTNALGFATHMHIPSKKLLSTMFVQNPDSIAVKDSPDIESELAKRMAVSNLKSSV